MSSAAVPLRVSVEEVGATAPSWGRARNWETVSCTSPAKAYLPMPLVARSPEGVQSPARWLAANRPSNRAGVSVMVLRMGEAELRATTWVSAPTTTLTVEGAAATFWVSAPTTTFAVEGAAVTAWVLSLPRVAFEAEAVVVKAVPAVLAVRLTTPPALVAATRLVTAGAAPLMAVVNWLATALRAVPPVGTVTVTVVPFTTALSTSPTS